MKKTTAISLLVFATACSHAPPAVPSSPVVQTAQVPWLPRGGSGSSAQTCQVDLTAATPPHSVRVGETTVGEEAGRDLLAAPDARRFACSLGATQAVPERSYLDTTGRLRWVVGLYRVPLPGEQKLSTGKGPNTAAEAAPSLEPPERARKVATGPWP